MKKMVDLKRSKTELEDMSSPKIAPTEGYQGPEYPWGLTLTLDDDTLTKLGMSKLPDVDDRFEIRAIAKVQAVRQNKHTGDEKQHRSVELQICKMAVSKPEASSAQEAVDDGIDEAADY